jgi:O-antigen ligase
MIFGIFIILYVPTRVDFEEFLLAVLIVSTGLVITGFIISLFGLTLLKTTFFSSMSNVFFGNGLYPYSSLFNNPNALGNLTKYGSISGIILFYRFRDRRILLFIFVSFVGLVLSQAHSEILAGILSIVLYLLYQHKFVRIFRWIVSIGLFIGTIFFVYVLFDPNNWIARMLLPRRRFLWSASLESISRKPILGYGLGYTGDYIEAVYPKSDVVRAGLNPDAYLSSHNSFLRMFLSTGIIGGLSYVYLFSYGFFLQISSKINWKSAGVICLMFCVIVSHMLQAYLIFGLRIQSILAGFILGYALQTSNQ